jgi:hypothetical protein
MKKLLLLSCIISITASSLYADSPLSQDNPTVDKKVNTAFAHLFERHQTLATQKQERDAFPSGKIASVSSTLLPLIGVSLTGWVKRDAWFKNTMDLKTCLMGSIALASAYWTNDTYTKSTQLYYKEQEEFGYAIKHSEIDVQDLYLASYKTLQERIAQNKEGLGDLRNQLHDYKVKCLSPECKNNFEFFELFVNTADRAHKSTIETVLIPKNTASTQTEQPMLVHITQTTASK